jgi:hypothetical protein
MALKTNDSKKLWGRSGNICSYPGCGVELAPEKKLNRLIGEEAHIKGEKPSAPRYDPKQTEEERESYENRILLCPTHHTEIDADPKMWTVSRLQQIKHEHEQQVRLNRQYPQILDDIKKLLQRYEVPEDVDMLSVSDVIEDASAVTVVRVDASKEGGIKTNLLLKSGQRVAFFARGLISYDNSGRHFTTPEGILCNEYGIPFLFKDESGNTGLSVWPHPKAYKTNGTELGRIGSLIGWIGNYSEQGAFLIGSKREIEASQDGYLHLMVNDAKGTYEDNDGEYRVDIRILE